MPKKGGKRKKTRTHKDDVPAGATTLDGKSLSKQIDDGIPRSIVAKGSKVAPKVSELIHDLRRLMLPYTASNLK